MPQFEINNLSFVDLKNMKKDVFTSAIGIGAGQLVLLLTTPFLARIYSPTEFGAYAALIASSSILATVASLRFDAALPAVANQDVKPLFQISIFLPLITSLCALFLATLTNVVEETLASIVVVPLSWIAMMGALLGATNVCQSWYARAGKFNFVATIKVLQPIIFSVTAFSAVAGLEGALIFSWFLVLLIAAFGCRKLFLNIDIKLIGNALKNSRHYPMLSVPMALLDTLSLAIPIFFIISEFGESSGGNYSQTQRLLAAPLILLGISVGQVFFKYAGDLYRSGESFEPLLNRIVLSLFGLGCLALVITYAFGEQLISFLLGDGWRNDLKFLILTILPILFRMIVSPISSAFLITNKLKILSLWQVLYFVVTASVLFLAKNRFDFEGYLLALCISEFIMYSIYLIFAIVVTRASKPMSASNPS